MIRIVRKKCNNYNVKDLKELQGDVVDIIQC